jgi:putative permease
MTQPPDYSNFPFFSDRFRRFLPNSQAITLALILIFGSLLIYLLADLLMPVFASIVLAYLLNGLVEKTEKKNIPRLAAVYMVFSGFMTCLRFCLICVNADGLGTSHAVSAAYSLI